MQWLNLLTNPKQLFSLGIIGVCVAVMAFLPKELGPLYCIWIPVGVIVLTLLIKLILWIRAVTKSKGIEKGILGQMEKDAREAKASIRGSREDIRKRFAEGLAELKTTAMYRRKGGTYFATNPWYLVAGPPAAGKTTLIQNSGVDFPVGKRSQGAGGTKDFHWWFSEIGILLDTAGNLAEPQEIEQHEQWSELLTMVRKFRKSRPIQGLLLIFPIDRLSEMPLQKVQQIGQLYRAHLDHLRGYFRIEFPTYIILSKCDLIPGFVPFFEKLATRISEPVGWTNTNVVAEADPTDRIKTGLSEVWTAFRELRPHLLTQADPSRDAEEVQKLFNLPEVMASTGDKIVELCRLLFRETEGYNDSHLCRGIYFTSAEQVGSPLAAFVDRLAERFGVPVTVVERAPNLDQAASSSENRNYFLHDILARILPHDRDLATPTNDILARRRLRARLAVYGTAVLSVLAGGLFGILGFSDRSDLTSTRELVAAALPAQPAAGQSIELDREKVKELVDRLAISGIEDGTFYDPDPLSAAATKALVERLNGEVREVLDRATTGLKNEGWRKPPVNVIEIVLNHAGPVIRHLYKEEEPEPSRDDLAFMCGTLAGRASTPLPGVWSGVRALARGPLRKDLHRDLKLGAERWINTVSEILQERLFGSKEKVSTFKRSRETGIRKLRIYDAGRQRNPDWEEHSRIIADASGWNPKKDGGTSETESEGERRRLSAFLEDWLKFLVSLGATEESDIGSYALLKKQCEYERSASGSEEALSAFVDLAKRVKEGLEETKTALSKDLNSPAAAKAGTFQDFASRTWDGVGGRYDAITEKKLGQPAVVEAEIAALTPEEKEEKRLNDIGAEKWKLVLHYAAARSLQHAVLKRYESQLDEWKRDDKYSFLDRFQKLKPPTKKDLPKEEPKRLKFKKELSALVEARPFGWQGLDEAVEAWRTEQVELWGQAGILATLPQECTTPLQEKIDEIAKGILSRRAEFFEDYLALDYAQVSTRENFFEILEDLGKGRHLARINYLEKLLPPPSDGGERRPADELHDELKPATEALDKLKAWCDGLCNDWTQAANFAATPGALSAFDAMKLAKIGNIISFSDASGGSEEVPDSLMSRMGVRIRKAFQDGMSAVVRECVAEIDGPNGKRDVLYGGLRSYQGEAITPPIARDVLKDWVGKFVTQVVDVVDGWQKDPRGKRVSVDEPFRRWLGSLRREIDDAASMTVNPGGPGAGALPASVFKLDVCCHQKPDATNPSQPGARVKVEDVRLLIVRKDGKSEPDTDLYATDSGYRWKTLTWNNATAASLRMQVNLVGIMDGARERLPPIEQEWTSLEAFFRGGTPSENEDERKGRVERDYMFRKEIVRGFTIGIEWWMIPEAKSAPPSPRDSPLDTLKSRMAAWATWPPKVLKPESR